MTVNEALWDRVARMLIGGLLIVLSILGVIGLWGWIGILPLVTGAVGYCPGYRIFGWSTCPIKKGSSGESSASG
jgi:predicted membrane channel-forming protein YqfA (hemolysin III family)